MRYPDTILIVDDNAANRKVICGVLTRKLPNSKIFEANSGEEAVDMVRDRLQNKTCNFDMIFMDYQMGAMNGETATKEIRKLENEQALKSNISYIVQWTTEPSFQNKLYEGADEKISKPIIMTEIIVLLQSYWDISDSLAIDLNANNEDVSSMQPATQQRPS